MEVEEKISAGRGPEKELLYMLTSLRLGKVKMPDGISPDKSVANFQNNFNPIWKVFSGGCNLNKDIPTLIASTFSLKDLDEGYIQGYKFESYHYWGEAIHKSE